MDLQTEPALTAFEIAQRLKGLGHTAYFAGGCVRDHLMGLQAHDIDIATSANPDAVEKIFPKTIPVGKQFGVIIVVSGGRNFEVATFRNDGKYQDGRHPAEV